MGKIKYYSPKRRAIYAAGEDFTHLEIFERDEWVCGICDKPINPSLRRPHLLCASLDHIVPISKCLELGWPLESIHTRLNVQSAHMLCNMNKSDSLDIAVVNELH